VGTTTRFIRPADNKILNLFGSTLPRIINGDTANFADPPALVEDPQYPMSNLLNPSLYTPWVTPQGTTPSTVELHIQTVSSTIAFLGFFGCRLLSLPFTASYRIASAGYSSTGPWTSLIGGSLDARHNGFVLAASTIGMYWRFLFTFAPASGFSIGSISLAPVTQDLGIVYSPGAEDLMVFPSIQSRNGAGHLEVVSVGDPRRLVVLPFRTVTDAMRTKIDAIFGAASRREPAVWIDQNDVARPVVLANSDLRWRHAWAPPNLWDCDVEIEVLG